MMTGDSVGRRPLHRRETICEAFLRDDGLIEIEARMRDLTPQGTDLVFHRLAPGQPIHDMRLVMTLDRALRIQRMRAVIAQGATPYCAEIEEAYAALQGLQIGPGFKQQMKARVGGVRGCTHLSDAVAAMATTAMQAMFALNREMRGKHHGNGPMPRPAVLDTCHAWRSDGQAVNILWPPHRRAVTNQV